MIQIIILQETPRPDDRSIFNAMREAYEKKMNNHKEERERLKSCLLDDQIRELNAILSRVREHLKSEIHVMESIMNEFKTREINGRQAMDNIQVVIDRLKIEIKHLDEEYPRD